MHPDSRSTTHIHTNNNTPNLQRLFFNQVNKTYASLRSTVNFQRLTDHIEVLIIISKSLLRHIIIAAISISMRRHIGKTGRVQNIPLV